MMARLNNIIIYFVLAVIGFNIFIFAIDNEGDEENHQEKIERDYNIYSLNIPDTFHFCKESVPLNNIDIKERFDRELLVNTYYQSQTLLYIKRSTRWFPIIEKILKKNNVPEDFKYLCLIESGLTNAVSPAGAKGFWQFMPSTGKEFGLEVNDEVDERYHVEKSTEAACEYLLDAYEKYDSWTLAAASYNMGMNGLSKSMSRQSARNYYDLLLNEETARYVFRILAAKEILNNALKYGFHVRKKDRYKPYAYTEIKIDSAIADFASFAQSKKINYKILKLFNPWLRQKYLRNKNSKSYVLKIPTEGFAPIGVLPSLSDSIKE
jgi:membrane-bound lytic murein transglycosylase D